MAEDRSAARRVRVERNIYRRPSGVYEVGFKDGGGKQRWRTVEAPWRRLRDQAACALPLLAATRVICAGLVARALGACSQTKPGLQVWVGRPPRAIKFTHGP